MTSLISKRLLVATLPIFLLTGCVEPLFYWGKYENSLVERYIDNNPAQTETHLRELMTEAESEHKRIPPGICADYGFALFKRGDKLGAITYFEKEKQLYPEATPFMTKLIERIKQQDAPKTGVAQ
jgi:hypothetical protein